MNKYTRVGIVAIVVLLLLVSSQSPRREASADFPVLTGIAIGVGSAAVIGGASWVWNKLTGKPKTTTEVTVEWTDDQGRKITRKVTREIDPAVSYKLPEDIQNFQMPPGYSIDEKMLLDARQDETVIIRYDIAQLSADVSNNPLDYVGYELKRVTTMQFDRPSGEPPDKASELVFDLDLQDLKIGTTDIDDTKGTSYYSITIKSPQLGILFEASGLVAQGGSFIRSGDIPLGRYLVTPGNATLNYKERLTFPIPPGINSVEVVYTFVSGGDGVGIDTPFFTRQVTYILAIIAIVVAVLGLGLGAIALMRRTGNP